MPIRSFLKTNCIVAAAILAAAAGTASAQKTGARELADAYKELAQKNYDAAIELFRVGLEKQPANAAAHKDLAYTLLKTGENADARDEFEAALKLNSRDETAALEYAFLAYETGERIQSYRMFDALRQTGPAATRATAASAFENIDKPLREGIARWEHILANAANGVDLFGTHAELARLAEERDDLPLAAKQYEICWKVKPEKRELLLALARVWRELGRVEDARAALLAASRSEEPRTSELAREQMDARYPYPYEFENALELDPRNVPLRRELAFLYLAMHKQSEAVQQFAAVLKVAPQDELAQKELESLRRKLLPAGETKAPVDAKALGEKSLALGYLPDAIRYLQQAHEQNPDDAEVMLKLGWAYNQSKDDADAIQWFDRARHSDDAQIAAEATKSWRNLNGDSQPVTTAWVLPMYSSRWGDLFSYGQVKRTVPLPWGKKANRFVSFYLSARFMGDVKSTLDAHVPEPQYLSESSLIFGAGAATKTWRHLTGWVEAGEAVQYLPFRHDTGTATPDYRSGVNFAKGFGHLLGTKQSGFFYETTADAIYVSRFDKDWLFYLQERAGRTFAISSGTSLQPLFDLNLVHDVKNQYWAETVEMGPGIRLHLPFMPPNVYFATDLLRGVYLDNQYNPRKPNYYDIRAGFWYAITR